ncbi:MAG: hypothetical protein LBS12_01130 [Prevotellaceae bacterium]|jgi:membrane protein implicated in regulation of membrane protease activity|nr:hypothetical protein [Prevotellaceae bacterium]
MDIWWNSLDLFLKIMWGIALVTSIIFIIQMIMTFAGMDADGDIAGDADGHGDAGSAPFQLFTFRNFINFFLGFAWTGIAFYPTIGNRMLLALLAALMGLLLVALVMGLFYAMSRTVQSGNIDIREAAGLTATVYIPIAARRARAGKVQLSIRQTVREYDAMTDGESIATGRQVRIVEVMDGHILLVEEI